MSSWTESGVSYWTVSDARTVPPGYIRATLGIKTVADVLHWTLLLSIKVNPVGGPGVPGEVSLAW